MLRIRGYRNTLAERVVVAGLDDRTSITVDDGADAAEVVAEVDERPVGDRAATCRTVSHFMRITIPLYK